MMCHLLFFISLHALNSKFINHKTITMKPKMVIGNWKMNKSFDEADDLIIATGEQLAGLRLETGL